MKVNNSGPNSMKNVDATAGKKVGAEGALDINQKRAANAADTGSSAKVELSQRAQDIKRAKELATPSDTINEAKVARLQALIDKGEYKVDAEAIADRLVNEHLLTPS